MAQKKKEQQILDLIKQHSAILIALPENPTTDAIASGLAILSVCEKLQRRAKVVSSDFQLPHNHSFIPKSDEIYDDLAALKKFIISLDVSRTSVEELSYNIDEDALNIYISPKDGYFASSDVSTSEGAFAFDLVITIDAQELDDLGRIYEMNAEFFYHTPVINIDHSPSNGHFGQVNYVHVTATSASEIIFELLESWGENLLDEFIATQLLTGMISKTKSFQSGSITPRSLAIASHLISQGARRDEIVKHLYQSKSIATLKLWGRALSKLESDDSEKIVWSIITDKDFQEAGASPEELRDVIDELIINTPDAQNVFLLYPSNGTVTGIISTAPAIDALDLFDDLEPSGTEHFIEFELTGRDTNSVMQMVRDRIKNAHSS